MLPNLKTSAIAAVTALSLALTAAAPAQALGKNERNFLKGVAAALIVGAIVNDAQGRTVPAPQPDYDHQPRYDHRYDDRRHGGRVVGSHNSVYATVAAQTFNSYSHHERRAIQSRLRAYGYYSGAVDGAFGPATYRAIVAYARDSGGERQLQTRAGSYGLYDSLIA